MVRGSAGILIEVTSERSAEQVILSRWERMPTVTAAGYKQFAVSVECIFLDEIEWYHGSQSLSPLKKIQRRKAFLFFGTDFYWQRLENNYRKYIQEGKL